ncbi:hypothetical protein Tco_0872395 [Tanacetum coccineum]
MLCLMKTHNMGGIVDDAYVSPRASRKEIMDQYDSLLKGWIFGSASENVLGTVIDLDSAKDVWNKLKSFYDASMSSEQGTPQFYNVPMAKSLEFSFMGQIRMQIILEANGLWEMIEPNEKTQADNKKDKTAIEDETIDTFTAKLTTLVNKAVSLGHTMEDETLVRKLLNAVPDRYLQIVASIKQYSDLSEMTLEEAIERLKTYEERIKYKRGKQVDNQEKLMFTRHENKEKYFEEWVET